MTRFLDPLKSDMPLHGWGGLGVHGREALGENLAEITEGKPLTRGLGRSYGDAGLPAPGDEVIAGSRMANRFLDWNPDTGVLRAEAGVSLNELRRVFLPKGWFTPVSPGTSFVTLGGMVASDVHGKGHHSAGTFGEHLTSLTMRLANGEIVTCGPDDKPDLFWATTGGMGLTGHILDVSFKMRAVPSPWIYAERKQCPNLDSLLEHLEEAAEAYPMTVGWIDCLSTGRNLGRGILMQGRWAELHETPAKYPADGGGPSVPFTFPNWALNDVTLKGFNWAYYHKEFKGFRSGVESTQTWWYPLDGIGNWSRIYGKRGFTQHQAVFPKAVGRKVIRQYVELIAMLGGSSFLCVIKDCRAEAPGTLSFPMEGISIALDFPMRADTQAIVDRLNEFVIEHGGRIYLAKDALTRREHFEAMEGERLTKFMEIRRKYDPDLTIRSRLSARLMDPEVER